MYICCSTGYIITWIEAFNCPSNEFFPHNFVAVKFFQLQIFFVGSSFAVVRQQFGPAKTRRYFKCYYVVVPSQCHQLWVYILAAYTHLWPVGPKNIRKNIYFFLEKKWKVLRIKTRHAWENIAHQHVRSVLKNGVWIVLPPYFFVCVAF